MQYLCTNFHGMDRTNHIKMAIREHGFTLSEVAEKIGIARQNFGQRLSSPTLELILQIADVTGVSLNELVGYTDRNETPFTCPHCGKRIRLTISPDKE